MDSDMDRETLKSYIYTTIDEYKYDVGLEDFQITMEDHQINITKNIINYGKCINENGENIINNFDKVSIISIIEACFKIYVDKHIQNIQEKLNFLNSIVSPEQRSTEWYAFRDSIISASDAKKACGNPYSKYYKELILKKLGYELPILHCDATIHGTIFEVVSQRVYETRKGVSIREYGCIRHRDYPFGASPDGIVNSIDVDHPNSTLSKISLIGRMLEIKNPFSREITRQIKDEYMYQMQLQLEVCNLPICDFLECNIRSAMMKYNKLNKTRTYTPIYDSIIEFLSDSLSPEDIPTLPINPGIPICNHSKDGNERGILLEFIKMSPGSSSQYKSVIFPIEVPYSFEAIETWKEEIIETMDNLGFQLNKVHFWKLFEFDIKIVERDDKFWNSTLKPGLLYFWKQVEYCKTLTQEERMAYFGDLLELVNEPENTISQQLTPQQQQQQSINEDMLQDEEFKKSIQHEPIEPKLIRKRKVKPDNFLVDIDSVSQYKFSDE